MTLLPSLYNESYPNERYWMTSQGNFSLFGRPSWWHHNMKPVAPGVLETGFRHLLANANPYFKTLFNYQRKRQAQYRKYEINHPDSVPPLIRTMF